MTELAASELLLTGINDFGNQYCTRIRNIGSMLTVITLNNKKNEGLFYCQYYVLLQLLTHNTTNTNNDNVDNSNNKENTKKEVLLYCQ